MALQRHATVSALTHAEMSHRGAPFKEEENDLILAHIHRLQTSRHHPNFQFNPPRSYHSPSPPPPLPRSPSSLSDEASSLRDEDDHEYPRTGSSFECHICLEVARDPVLSICGHLFCRSCIKRWLRSRPNAYQRTCPVCKMNLGHDHAVLPIHTSSSTGPSPRSQVHPEARRGRIPTPSRRNSSSSALSPFSPPSPTNPLMSEYWDTWFQQEDNNLPDVDVPLASSSVNLRYSDVQNNFMQETLSSSPIYGRAEDPESRESFWDILISYVYLVFAFATVVFAILS
ncbi:hypothetical protein KP509_20G005100 [Ceratopteris richardii]|uniref:RING-type E3 ubiquitin transferase n=1 Tax=Ceratopteris richardii TaxID=49495 RepID=A0A8T2SFM3_CERRI|nr:hypothetical protein KP509_20G005100 [Ceratopteris richardii]